MEDDENADLDALSRAVHTRCERRPADLPVAGVEVGLTLQLRRFFCRNAGFHSAHVCRTLARPDRPNAPGEQPLRRPPWRWPSALRRVAGSRTSWL